MTHEEFLAAVAEVKAAERALKAAMRKVGTHYQQFFLTSSRIADLTILMAHYYHDMETAIRSGKHD